MINHKITYFRPFSFYAVDPIILIALKQNYYSRFPTNQKSRIKKVNSYSLKINIPIPGIIFCIQTLLEISCGRDNFVTSVNYLPIYLVAILHRENNSDW